MSKAIHFKIALISTIFILSGIKSAYAHYSYDNYHEVGLSAPLTNFNFLRKDISINQFIKEKIIPHKNLFHHSNTAGVRQLLPFSSEDLYACVYAGIVVINRCVTRLSLSKDCLSDSNSRVKSIDSFQSIGVCHVSQITSENQVMIKCIKK